MKNFKSLVGHFWVTASLVLGASGAQVLTVHSAHAQQSEALPLCKKKGVAFPVNNDIVLNWKKTTKNQYLDRGYISGVVIDTCPGRKKREGSEDCVVLPTDSAERKAHDHFVVMIGKDKSESIEVIYNTEFGDLPSIRLGMQVEACGDYITATAKSGPYPPSPVGAIIHWVHMSPSDRHEDGFVRIDGKMYGNRYDGSPKQKPNKPNKPKKPRRPGDIARVAHVEDDAA